MVSSQQKLKENEMFGSHPPGKLHIFDQLCCGEESHRQITSLIRTMEQSQPIEVLIANCFGAVSAAVSVPSCVMYVYLGDDYHPDWLILSWNVKQRCSKICSRSQVYLSLSFTGNFLLVEGMSC